VETYCLAFITEAESSEGEITQPILQPLIQCDLESPFRRKIDSASVKSSGKEGLKINREYTSSTTRIILFILQMFINLLASS